MEQNDMRTVNNNRMPMGRRHDSANNHLGRIWEKHVDVSYEEVAKFFEERAQNNGLKHKYNYVLFQDDTPELAVQRDVQEKNKICKLLEFKKNNRILDIGCGIGRWGERLCEEGLYYVGVDGSASLIERARENLAVFSSKNLLVGHFQELLNVLEMSGEEKVFDMVFVNGVFMYLNDVDFEKALLDIKKICAPTCQIYIKESMGVEKRLSLDNIYSDGLKQNYSAIYRSIDEYREATRAVFGESFNLYSEGNLFDDSLHNRKETVDYYLIWKRWTMERI